MKYFRHIFILTMVFFLIGCSNSILDTPNNSNTQGNVPSEGSLSNPIALSIDNIHNFTIGNTGIASYYQIYIPNNNYYDSEITNIIGSNYSGYFEFKVYSDPGFSINYDGGTVMSMSSSIRNIKLYKNKTYYIKCNNIESNGISFDFKLKAHTPYPQVSTVILDNSYSSSIGNYGVFDETKFYSFTTTLAGYYNIFLTYSTGYISTILFDFAPGYDSHPSGTAYPTYIQYTLLANTTYYFKLSTSDDEPIAYVLKVAIN